MQHSTFKFSALVALAFCSNAHAITSEALMSQAIHAGQASGELTGPVADRMKSQTHSKGPTLASVTRISIEPDKCHFYKFITTQTQIPDVTGRIVGDYVIVTKNKYCPDDRPQAPPEIIDCRIAGTSCMPPKAR